MNLFREVELLDGGGELFHVESAPVGSCCLSGVRVTQELLGNDLGHVRSDERRVAARMAELTESGSKA